MVKQSIDHPLTTPKIPPLKRKPPVRQALNQATHRRLAESTMTPLAVPFTLAARQPLRFDSRQPLIDGVIRIA